MENWGNKIGQRSDKAPHANMIGEAMDKAKIEYFLPGPLFFQRPETGTCWVENKTLNIVPYCNLAQVFTPSVGWEKPFLISLGFRSPSQWRKC